MLSDTGGSCHSYPFCRDKNMFVATKHVFCRDTHMFVATKVILVAAPANDSQNFTWCSHIQMHGDQYRVLVYSPSIPTNKRLEVRVPHLYLDCCFEIHFQLKAVKSCTMRGPTESFSDCWRYMLKEQSTVCGPTESFNYCWRYMPKWRY